MPKQIFQRPAPIKHTKFSTPSNNAPKPKGREKQDKPEGHQKIKLPPLLRGASTFKLPK